MLSHLMSIYYGKCYSAYIYHFCITKTLAKWMGEKQWKVVRIILTYLAFYFLF